MRYQVRLSRRARRELALIRAWWRRNRPAASDAIDDELDKTRALLERHPEAGPVAADPDLVGVRRLVLPGVGYIVYYEVDPTDRRVLILTVWHARRRAPRP